MPERAPSYDPRVQERIGNLDRLQGRVMVFEAAKAGCLLSLSEALNFYRTHTHAYPPHSREEAERRFYLDLQVARNFIPIEDLLSEEITAMDRARENLRQAQDPSWQTQQDLREASFRRCLNGLPCSVDSMPIVQAKRNLAGLLGRIPE